MKTINLRLLVTDETDPEELARRIFNHSKTFGEVQGVVDLVGDGWGRLLPAPQVRTRPNVQWDGNSFE